VKSVLLLCVGLLIAQQTSDRQASPATDDSGVPSAVLNAERRWAGAEALLPLARSEDAATARYALRALGRLEDPSLVPNLLALVARPAVAPAAADAIAQTLKGFDPQQDPAMMAVVAERLRGLADTADIRRVAGVMALGRIRYFAAEDVTRAERLLDKVLGATRAAPQALAVRSLAVRSFESLARVNTKLVAFEPDTLHELGSIVAKTNPNDSPEVRLYALTAMISARGLDRASLDLALEDQDEQVRRVAMAALAGNAVAVDAEAVADDIIHGLADRSFLVRYESLRAFVRRVASTGGCAPVLDAMRDPSPHVALAAIDAAGDLCRTDEAVTSRVLAEARTPPVIGSWHREAHAFVALAKRSPEQAAISMQAFSSHPAWQVRMYAARAAAAMEDTPTLEKLASDANDNVREAALTPLRKLDLQAAEPALVAALARTDYQLLRTAALLLKDAAPARRLFRPLADALLRVTREAKDTSRDTRIALLDAIDVHGSRDDVTALTPLLKDFDPRIATHVAELITRSRGTPAAAEPPPPFHSSAIETPKIQQCAAVGLKNGRTFRMSMAHDAAPVTVGHFLKLALEDHYYDGLTFHRIVPNFIIQGGSPGANEYAGQKAYMRDEIERTNGRGTVGLSTRGRNTGDAQFYINLVDNPRLDYDYTIFASVFAADMSVVDDIQEGDAIARIAMTSCR
jgi:cyclophilin family peptidyl-prolyl cis-trans isomerase